MAMEKRSMGMFISSFSSKGLLFGFMVQLGFNSYYDSNSIVRKGEHSMVNVMVKEMNGIFCISTRTRLIIEG